MTEDSTNSASTTNVGDYELSDDIALQLKRNEAGLVPAIVQSERGEAVSYTHLTLPTILRV